MFWSRTVTGLVLRAASCDVPLLGRQFPFDKAAVYPGILDIVQLSCHRKSPITHPPKVFQSYLGWTRKGYGEHKQDV